ncbi:XAP5, circadian clock regulator-domain-containing protein [Sordaria brevicollis]|uniref:XAP5, circadian clock regulator-domain-containing protein n=1 Tax=Sordaria brevicollis TaxID=83679 RepID=A0AAE0PHK8_SORBR|nr:XAP5, circadian clock regulator-domain-containing protein [Sordaria brevicollis]
MSDPQPPSGGASTPNPTTTTTTTTTNTRFAPQNQTVQERVSSSTVGLVNLADFRKRRAEVLEQQHREVREAAIAAARGGDTTDTSAAATPSLDRSATGTPAPAGIITTDGENGGEEKGGGGEKGEGVMMKEKKMGGERKAKRIKKRALVSFGDEEEEGEELAPVVKKKAKTKTTDETTNTEGDDQDQKESPTVDTTENTTTRETSADPSSSDQPKKKIVNTNAPIIPRALTKAALRREAAEREAIRKEFLAKQAVVKATEIAIPFVFYDGTNIPGGMVRVKKGDHAWLFLDKSRKVGAERGVGQDKILNARRAWARVSVDDLLLVRGSVIIPHHYEFYFFIINKTMGPGNVRLFNYTDDAPIPSSSPSDPSSTAPSSTSTPDPGALSTPQSRLAALPDISTLEGANDDPTFTKVVDRRWYQRNKHIYPASTWQEFDPEKDYQREIRRDLGGNAFFFAR